MRSPWWWRRRLRQANGDAARRAKEDAQRRLAEARRRRPEVDKLSAWIDEALRGGRA